MRDSTTFVISGTKTYRLGSRKILSIYGGNLQNIEKSMREIYIPDGWSEMLYDKCSYYLQSKDISIFTPEELANLKIFVQTDQAGAEALIVAYLCRAGNFRDLFIHGVKPHVYVALHVFKDVWKKKMREGHMLSEGFDIDEVINTPIKDLKSIPYWRDLDLLIKDSDNWTLTERYYYLAKQTCHSANYGIQPPTFRMNILEKSGGKIVISKEDSEHFLRTYHSLFPEIQEWHREVRRQVEATKMLYNLHGHPYSITSYDILESQWKELYSWVPQSTVGEITNVAYSNMQEFIERENKPWDMLVNCHDSILNQCAIGQEIECGKKQKECIEQEFTSPMDGVKFSMRSETQVGFNWSNFKEKNKLGLREVKV